jgi:hypothetical protein
MRTVLARTAALVLVAGMTGLAACGTEEVRALDVVRTAAAATVAEETARVTVSLDTEASALDASASFIGRLDGSELEGTVQVAFVEVAVRVVDEIAYARPFGDRWLGVDLARLAERAPETEILRGSDILDALGQVTDVVVDGSEEIDGTTTQRYRAVIDLDALTAELPPALTDAVATKVGGEVPVTVWIDANDLVRRVVVEAGPEGEHRLQVDVTDLGVAVDVDPPPADQVTMLG